jgi:hypothetical protein
VKFLELVVRALTIKAVGGTKCLEVFGGNNGGREARLRENWKLFGENRFGWFENCAKD